MGGGARVCRRCLVNGKVQGVSYRASTQRKAFALGVVGHAINLPDGQVEVVVCGPEEAVQALGSWLWQGPPAARVEGVECEAIAEPGDLNGFRTG